MGKNKFALPCLWCARASRQDHGCAFSAWGALQGYPYRLRSLPAPCLQGMWYKWRPCHLCGLRGMGRRGNAGLHKGVQT